MLIEYWVYTAIFLVGVNIGGIIRHYVYRNTKKETVIFLAIVNITIICIGLYMWISR